MDLASLAAVAAGIGVVHTVAGPDHYVPLVALARSRGWSRRRTLVTTACCALAHCGAAAALVAVLLVLAQGAGAVAGFEAIRGQLAAWLLIGLGCVLGAAAWRGRRAPLPVTGFLAVAFVLGPCEWLVPAAMGAATSHGVVGVGAVVVAFTAGTAAAMLSAVWFGCMVWRSRGAVSARSAAFAGLATAASGALVLIGF